MREPDLLTQQLVLWLLFLVLAVAGFTQISKIASVVSEQLNQSVAVKPKVRL